MQGLEQLLLTGPPWAGIALWAFVGLFVGSFLNVAIHRLPLEGETVSFPRRSRCPDCRTELTWKENLPLVSWLFLRGRCRSCGWSIPARYPAVEALTALLWGLSAWSVEPRSWGDWGMVVLFSTVLAGLVVATFVDFACFEIPDEVSIGGMFAAVVFSLALPGVHEGTWVARAVAEGAGGQVDRFGALLGCLAGMAVGGGVLWVIGWIGTKAYGTDAMGFGDVKLLAAGGGFVGPGGALAALMIAAMVASVAGIGNMLRFLCLSRARARSRGRSGGWQRSLRVARIAGRYLPFGPYLALGIGIVLLYWNHVLVLFG